MTINWKNVWRKFFPQAFILFATAVIISAVAQQTLRFSGDATLIDQAESIATTLNSQSAKGLQANSKVEVEKSSGVFVIVIDKDGTENYSSVQLDGSTPKLPEGVIKAAQEKGRNRVTWEPKKGVRISTVVVPYASQSESGVIVVGRSAKIMDEERTKINEYTLLGLISSILILFIILILQNIMKNDAGSTKNVKTTSSVKKEVKPVVKSRNSKSK